jgi:ABC-type transport system involved in multi-copper enzyme maturation permease subunit
MNLETLNFRHISLISRYWNRYAVRSGSGLVYLLIALVFGLSVAEILITPVEHLMARQKEAVGRTDPDSINRTIIDVGKPVLRFVLGSKSLEEIAKVENPGKADPGNTAAGKQTKSKGTDINPWVRFLLEDKPALLSAIFLVLVFGMPFAISFLAFNQVAGDIQTYGLRYLLLRTDRSSIYFGRFLGTVAFSTVVVAIIVAIITLYLGVKLKMYPAADLAGWAVCGFLALSILMVPYIALNSLVSACVSSPFLSLVSSKIIIAGALILPALGSLAWKPAKYFKYVLPWGWQNNLFHPDPAYWGSAVLACLVYAAIFLMLGYYRFEKRDL